MNVFKIIHDAYINNSKLLAVLIDPENMNASSLLRFLDKVNNSPAQMILVGGSIVSKPMDSFVSMIKQNSQKPVVLFPGGVNQLTAHADGLLLLSLISGRNPEYLIGQQVQAAPIIKRMNLEVIPTGYILIESGKTSAVEYVSNTRGIPPSKVEIITATAMAGEMMGNKAIYLEGGSGALSPISAEIIRKVSSCINIPLIAGGGVVSPEAMLAAFDAGATMVVAGNVFERTPELLSDFSTALLDVNS